MAINDDYWKSSLDAWITREPVERRFEEELVWIVEGYSPHQTKPVEIGEFDSEEQAYHAANRWILRAMYDDPEWHWDYYTDTHEVDLLEECSCFGRLDRNCTIHGIDPDDARDARLDR